MIKLAYFELNQLMKEGHNGLSVHVEKKKQRNERARTDCSLPY